MINLRPLSYCFTANGHHRWHFKREKLWINSLEVKVRFLNLVNYVMRIILGKLLQHVRFDFICENCTKKPGQINLKVLITT